MVEDGPDVGEVAPDFTLKDINGKDFTLSSFKKIKPVVLFFGSCT
ncbi:TPA: redoxin domain-containing protein [bacterium]|nr:redoxin domain-containing protein [bacterium]